MRSQSFPVGDTVYEETLDNGLQVILLPKPGFQQVFCSFTTRYGSIDNCFRTAGESAFRTVPDGVAHFLEHKMFESEQGDVFPAFGRGGASANAFTTFDQTSYLFSCTDNLRPNLELLLDFVQDPYFTDATVAKEKGIIGQEIQMYQDNPDARIFYELLKALYVSHPVRIEVAGSVESIAQITKETLYDCYHTFYHPSNMVVFAAGGFDPVPVMEQIRENQARKRFSPAPVVERHPAEEGDTVRAERVETPLAVSQPRCLIGWKDAPGDVFGSALLTQELATGVAMEAMFGRSSHFFDEAVADGLIDNQFSWEYERAVTYGFSVIGGNTPDPDRLTERVQRQVDEVVEGGIDEADFERCRRKAIGRFVATLDVPSAVARSYISYHLRGAQVFDTVPVLESLDVDQVNERVREHFVPGRRAVSIVHP
ncbi:MAG: insulinase family protein [Alicyclobacillus sp.]|nr:insulinase family protein [Alicyclobacillus sp.]